MQKYRGYTHPDLSVYPLVDVNAFSRRVNQKIACDTRKKNDKQKSRIADPTKAIIMVNIVVKGTAVQFNRAENILFISSQKYEIAMMCSLNFTVLCFCCFKDSCKISVA